jgi:ribosomal-protein-alanine N-acetyltransferase
MGYAFEAAHKLKEAAFEEFHLSEISGITVKKNIASMHLLKKLGLTFEKVIEFPNATEEVHLYKFSPGKT